MVTWLQKTWIYAHPQEPDRKRPKLSESHAAISNHCAWILNHGCQWLFLCFHLSWEKMDSYIRHPSMINSMWFKLQREMFLHNLQDNLNSCPNDNTPCSALSLYTDSVKEKKLTRKQSMVRERAVLHRLVVPAAAILLHTSASEAAATRPPPTHGSRWQKL